MAPLELLEQRLAALEVEVGALKRRVEGSPSVPPHAIPDNGALGSGPAANPEGREQPSPPQETNPWLRIAGIYDKDDPLVKEWIEIMAENRRKADEDPDYL